MASRTAPNPVPRTAPSPEPLVEPETAEESSVPLPWSWQLRAVVSAAIAFHLFAIIAAPLAGPPPASDLARDSARLVEPYLQAAYLNHGYRFFAPTPGPGQLIRCELTMPDGKVQIQTFPDPQKISPRLLYHRYLILAAVMHETGRTPDDDTSLVPQWRDLEGRSQSLRAGGNGDEADVVLRELKMFQQAYRHDLARKQALLASVGRYMLGETGAVEVKFYAVTRAIPAPGEIRTGTKLDDSRYLSEQYLGRHAEAKP